MRIIIDSREQCPLNFPEDVETISGTLAAGDYSMPGFEEDAAVERKELGDLLACIGPERERFKRELLRLRSYPCRAVVIEGTLADILAGNYRSKVNPASVVGSIASWMNRYHTPFLFCGDRAGAAQMVLAMLRTYRDQVQAFLEAVEPSPA
ncbi:MAG: ERCC4 domain-containing protein [Lentisphaerota bacterium]